MFLDAFGPIRIHSDLFGCVWMRSDAFGYKWRVSEKSDFFEIVGDIFGRFQMALRDSWSVSNVMLSFDRFLDVLDEISYLLSLVIYREPPLSDRQNSFQTAGRPLLERPSYSHPTSNHES